MYLRLVAASQVDGTLFTNYMQAGVDMLWFRLRMKMYAFTIRTHRFHSSTMQIRKAHTSSVICLPRNRFSSYHGKVAVLMQVHVQNMRAMVTPHGMQ